MSQTFYRSQNNCVCGHRTCKPKITKLSDIQKQHKLDHDQLFLTKEN